MAFPPHFPLNNPSHHQPIPSFIDRLRLDWTLHVYDQFPGTGQSNLSIVLTSDEPCTTAASASHSHQGIPQPGPSMSSAYASQTRRPAPAYTRRQYVRLARIILMIHDGLRDSPMMRRIYKINLVDGSGTNRAPVAALIDHAVSSQTGPSLSSLEDDEIRRLLLSPFPTICLFNGNISTVGGVGFVLCFQSLPEESDVIWIPTALIWPTR